MNKYFSALLLAGGLLGLTGTANTAHATTYAGNGNTGFGGAVGSGMFAVTSDGAGGIDFAYTLGTGTTANGFNGTNNNLVIYIDNGKGGGIGADTSLLTDAGDGTRESASEFDGMGDRSLLNFGGFMSPQYAISISSTDANIFSLVNSGGNNSFGFAGGSGVGMNSQNGVTYTQSGSTFTVDVPEADLGLSSATAANLELLAINVSNTGYSSNEGSVALAGNDGYEGLLTAGSANAFTAPAAGVPEPGTWAMLLTGTAGLVALGRRRLQA